ncbi:hypothetical protein TNCV_1793221 [Trichonephila clavipes]|nr:hypothetical protein TNCV_1793221 [Trichonephila clavipes]
MSDSSDQMVFSPTNFEQVAACEKLRDIQLQVSQPFICRFTGWTDVHPGLIPIDSGHDQEKRGNEVAACEKLRDTVHSISALHSSMLEGARTPTPKNSFLELYQMSTYAMAKKKDELDSNINESTSDKIIHKVKKKKQSKKRKNKNKESSEEFIFPKKTARPVSPISTQDPIETKNNFSDLEQDVEHPLPTDKNVISEKITPPTKLPPPRNA